MLKRRADGVRRGQLKLRVREDEISVVRILSNNEGGGFPAVFLQNEDEIISLLTPGSQTPHRNAPSLRGRSCNCRDRKSSLVPMLLFKSGRSTIKASSAHKVKTSSQLMQTPRSVMRGQRAREKQMQRVKEEREMVRTKLSNLYKLMVQASEAEAAQVQRSESMGAMLSKDLSTIEDALKVELKKCVRSQAEEETKK